MIGHVPSLGGMIHRGGTPEFPLNKSPSKPHSLSCWTSNFLGTRCEWQIHPFKTSGLEHLLEHNFSLKIGKLQVWTLLLVSPLKKREAESPDFRIGWAPRRGTRRSTAVCRTPSRIPSSPGTAPSTWRRPAGRRGTMPAGFLRPKSEGERLRFGFFLFLCCVFGKLLCLFG